MRNLLTEMGGFDWRGGGSSPNNTAVMATTTLRGTGILPKLPSYQATKPKWRWALFIGFALCAFTLALPLGGPPKNQESIEAFTSLF